MVFPLINFAMTALQNPMAAGMQMALEGIKPEVIQGAIQPPQMDSIGQLMQASAPGMAQGMPQPQPDRQGSINPHFSDPMIMTPEQLPQNQTPQMPTQQQLQGQYAQDNTAQIMQTGGGPSDLQGAFISRLQERGLTNPNALAAVAATGQHESRFDPANVFGTWSDPSESGQAGTSGGALSWRAERLQNLMARGDGSSLPPITTQADFFYEEDPALIRQLNAAETPEQAQMLMNNAWKFAGFDKPGGEAGRRISTASRIAMGGDSFLAGGDTRTAEAPDMSGGDGRFTTADMGGNTESVMGYPTTGGQASAPKTKAQLLAEKLGAIGKGVKAPEQQPAEPPRIAGGIQPDVGGQYNPRDQQLLMLLLGANAGQGAQGIPPLSQLIKGAV